MLHQVLCANCGLPRDCFVVFQNTGKEREETLAFVDDCARRWSVPVAWIEWTGFIEGRAQRFCTYQLVTFATAARHGEPFAAMTRAANMLPNPAARLCTINLKMRASSAYMRAQGFEEWDSVIGIRADEPRRVARMMDPARDNSNGVPVLPLVRANVTKADVLAFWRAQPFDLQLDPMGDLGNCDCCFLKARHKIVRALVAEPWRAEWWIGQESAEHGATFRNDRPPYRDLKREALFYARQIPLALEDSDEDALIDCFCGD
ncbi:phosphoadenosine phosphosulfate reductase family protein [Paraburkholderia caffeinilytica]|uniref:phosphoadenosine phosphosulfate reductase family protein n=1 Tax=Paraburkholderia caffeinilytica TaxID=1761016 RepID=UPI003DA12429